MRAVAYLHSLSVDAADTFVDIDLPQPVPGPRDLVVRVEAVSVNPVDMKTRQGTDPKGTPKVLGYDAAGTVQAVGAEVTLFKPGDRVFYAGSIVRPGSDSELHAADERIVGPMPETLSFAEAAALPLTAITAWELLFDRIGVKPGDMSDKRSLLVVGGAGGVGSAAIGSAATRGGAWRAGANAMRSANRGLGARSRMGAPGGYTPFGRSASAVAGNSRQSSDLALSRFQPC